MAMATPDDMRANAEYIRMADEVVDVPGGECVCIIFIMYTYLYSISYLWVCA